MNYEYKVGGSLPPDAPTYVWRQADRDLYNYLRSGTFCYVLNSRQMGKSSLLVQTMQRLQKDGIACAAIDLTEIISPDITRSEFYGSLTDTFVDSFNLAAQIGSFDAWWGKHSRLSPIKRLSKFIKEVLLTNSALLEKNIVIFLDEIDSVLRLPFSSNDFFGLIRACYNNRADQPEYNRLTFAILGVASPSDLIRNKERSTPFNFGQAIELAGFQLAEAAPLAEGLKIKSKNYFELLAAVLSWTGGQPFLTQKLCKIIIDSDRVIPDGGEAKWLEKLVRSSIIENWESQDEPEHLRTIRDRILRDEKRSVKLLKLYQQILQFPSKAEPWGRHSQVEPGNERNERNETKTGQMELRLSGLVVKHSGKLKVRNRIYELVFDRNWVEKSLNYTQPQIEPLDEEFIKTLAELERKLLVSQLSQITEGKSSDRALYEVLRDVTLQIGDLLGADRATIYLLNEEKTELWSVVAENQGGEFLDIQVRLGDGIAGQVAKNKKAINIPANVYEYSRSELVKEYDKKYGYRTYNMLAFPIVNAEKELVAVIQLLNKLNPAKNQQEELAQKIDRKGFTKLDKERLAKFTPFIQRILESCRSSYKATKKLRATAALAEATRCLDKSSLDTKEILQRVMDSAKKLMNADRSTLWLLDSDRGDLWTELPKIGEKRCEIGVGFAGQVAQTLEPIVIPFDLYDHPNAGNAKKTDKETGYRTCSLLCMPVLNPEGKLLGVTQLLNKRKQGDFPEYNPAEWPKAPSQFKASFDENDRQCMQVFNERAGVILQYAKIHEKLKQLAEVKQKEVVHNTLAMLSNTFGSQNEESFYDPLYNMLNFITQSASKLVRADRTTIFIFNSETKELWSLISEFEDSIPSEIKISASHPLITQLLQSKSKKTIWKPFKLAAELPYNQKIYHRIVLPFWSGEGQLVAAIEFINKLKLPRNSQSSFSEQIDPEGFTELDFVQLKERADSLLPILEGCESFYRHIQTIQEQRVVAPLWSGISSVSENSWNSEKILSSVMEEAKKLTNADRSTLWLFDRQRNQLWTKLPDVGELRCQIGVGFVGQVAQTRQAIIIPFDLYDFPGSENAKKTDRETGYRTCSLLCMPILSFDGELLGVTQLLNKRKQISAFSSSQYRSNLTEYKSANWPEVPDHFQASFNEKDLRYMEIFNNQIAISIQNAHTVFS